LKATKFFWDLNRPNNAFSKE